MLGTAMGGRGGLTLAAAGLGTIALLVASCEVNRAPSYPLRIVLVTLDTLRLDRFEATHERPTVMPRTRAFAERGARFTSFWASSSTTQPTHATLFTGLHPWQHGVPRNGTVLAEHHRTLAERLRQEGFTTAAVVASFPLDPRFGFDQGFDVFEHSFEHVLTLRWEGAPVDAGRFYTLADSVTARALRLLEEASGPRQFFWFHYFDPHSPYGDSRSRPLPLARLFQLRNRAPESFERELETARRFYDEDVLRLDRSLARLYDRLEKDDGFETHVVVTSDHGESFGEKGALGHGWRVTSEEVQVPLVIVSPRLEPGVRHDVAGTADLTTTLLAMAGLNDPALPGRDLTNPAATGEGSAVGMSGAPTRSLDPDDASRRERFFAVRHGTLYAGDAGHVIEEDVPEQVVQDGPLAESLRLLFAGFQADLSAQTVEERREAETQEALRALGYVE
jgi:arylsulfatase A-like enzyme